MTDKQILIVNAAVKLIAENGYQYLTMNKIAKEIGVSEPAIYRHFERKLALMIAILEQFEIIANEIINRTENNQLVGLDSIEAFIINRYILFEKNPNLTKVMIAEEIFLNNEKLAEKALKFDNKKVFMKHKI